ncbi:hypothetical protein BU16DRAFT_559601 [Lophium mytilinum]|uniref:Uncharacterized protein n=1 Tax=Lophium mytilinum TaxID=390894 RepID=A0A6A6QZG7_9PEZI|nr:hypothetical protein BU16DRAFT_559601 [Lophium mytilinum]
MKRKSGPDGSPKLGTKLQSSNKRIARRQDNDARTEKPTSVNRANKLEQTPRRASERLRIVAKSKDDSKGYQGHRGSKSFVPSPKDRKPSHNDRLKPLRDAYAADRIASLDFARKFHSRLPPELRNEVYKELLPKKINVGRLSTKTTRNEIVDMLGHPRYCFPSYVGRDVAREALKDCYSNTLFIFTHNAHDRHNDDFHVKLDAGGLLWWFLHVDVFGLGVVPRNLIRHIELSVFVDRRDQGVTNARLDWIRREPSHPEEWIDWSQDLSNEDYEKASQELLEQAYIKHDHVRHYLGQFLKLSQNANLRVNVHSRLRRHASQTALEFRHVSPLLFKLRDKGWNVKVTYWDHAIRSNRAEPLDMTICFDKSTEQYRNKAYKVLQRMGLTSPPPEYLYEHNKSPLLAWYLLQLHDHYNVYVTMQGSKDDIESSEEVDTEQMDEDEWRGFCARTASEEMKRIKKRVNERKRFL